MADPPSLARASNTLDDAMTSPDPERVALVRRARAELDRWLAQRDDGLTSHKNTQAAVPIPELEQLAEEWGDYHDGSTGNAVIAFKHCEQDLRKLMNDYRTGLEDSDGE